MAKKTAVILVAVLLLGVGLCGLIYWTNSRTNVANTNVLQPIRGIDPNEISTLENGALVRFPATIVTRLGDDCVQIFTVENFRKYEGDPKWAFPATFVNGPSLADRFRAAIRRNNDVVLTGRMSFKKEMSNGPCDIVTGQLFEITEINYAK